MASSSDAGDLLLALTRAGVPATTLPGGDLLVDGVVLPVQIEARAVVTLPIAKGLPQRRGDVLGVVLADRVSKDARRELVDRGWGWVDRRGHVRIWMKGLRISAGIEPLRSEAPGNRFASVFPPVGVEVALALLEAPAEEWSVKRLAAATGRARGGVSERLKALRDAGLVDRRNRPILPELFWELVAPWHERPLGLASFSGLDGPFDRLSWIGLPDRWVLTETQAALALGAPIIASADGPPDFYVPERSMVDLAVSHFGPARGLPAASVRAIRYAGIERPDPFRRTGAGIQVAHPVVVALDLAHDRARGREIVEAWDPTPLGVSRVW